MVGSFLLIEMSFKYIKVAAKNTVLHCFLRVLDIRDRVRLCEKAMCKRFVRNLRVVAEVLDHVFIKLCKPVVYVPTDIDIPVDRGYVEEGCFPAFEEGLSYCCY